MSTAVRVALAVGIAVLAAACGYAPPTISVSDEGRRICAPETPRTPAQLQAVFDVRGPWWAGADGGFAVDLPDGRRLWLFGDTIVGQVHHRQRRYLDDQPMVNNSLLVQSGRCFEVRMNKDAAGRTTSALAHPDPSRMWWPVSGFFDPARSRVVLIALRQDSSNWFVNRGMDAVELSWPDLRQAGHTPLDFDTENGFPALGTTVLHHAGFLYAYGAPVHGRDKPSFVARTPWPPAPVPRWEYWSDPGWSADPLDLEPMVTTAGPPSTPSGRVAGAMQVTRIAGTFVGITKPNDGVDAAIEQWTAPAPQGPWRPAGRLAGPARYNHIGWTYGARVYRLPGGAWVLLRSENPMSMRELYDDTLRYGIKLGPWTPPAP